MVIELRAGKALDARQRLLRPTPTRRAETRSLAPSMGGGLPGGSPNHLGALQFTGNTIALDLSPLMWTEAQFLDASSARCSCS